MIEINEKEMSELQKKLEIQLRQDFIDDCTQKIENTSDFFENIAEGNGDATDNLLLAMGEIHSIKGMGSSFGYPSITVVAHKMEDFLTHKEILTLENIKDAYIFIDIINGLLKRDTQPSSQEISDIARSLPSSTQEFGIKEQTQRSIEVLSIMPKSIQQRLIGDELAACGFHVSCLNSSFEAIEFATNTKPDLIVISAIIDSISGVELANIMRAIEVTKDTPIIVVTSFDERRLSEDILPEKVAIARKDKNFTDDLSLCLIELNMME